MNPSSARASDPRWVTSRETLEVVIVGAAVLAVYVVTMMVFDDFETSPDSFFHLLADSFLNGRTDLIDPPRRIDLVQWEGKWYLPFPPLPAIAMLPAVAALGVTHVNVALFVALAGSVTASIFLLCLRAWSGLGWTTLNRRERLLLTGAFAFGSIHWYMATTSTVWYVAQVTTCCFAMVAVCLASSGGSAMATGAALGFAIMGRPHVITLSILLYAIARERRRMTDRTWQPMRWLVGFAVPVVAAFVFLAAYNWVRFGAPFEFGYMKAGVADVLASDLHNRGQFNIAYLPRNAYYTFLAPPRWSERAHFWTPSPQGMSVLLTMPYLAWMFRFRVDRRSKAAVASLALGLVAPLMYFNTGAFQFGSRFFLDVAPAAYALLAWNMRSPLSRTARTAIIAAVAVNAAGTIWWHWPR